MDDLNFRRAIYTDPKTQDAEVLAAMHTDALKRNNSVRR